MIFLKKQKGSTLIITLILILVMSLIVLSQLENQVLHKKMQAYFFDKQITFNNAEIGLKIAGDEVENKPIVEPSVTGELTHHIELISTDSCANQLYLLTAEAKLASAKTSLKENYLKQHLPVMEGCKNSNMAFGKITWSEK